jgi:hypothetical protein
MSLPSLPSSSSLGRLALFSLLVATAACGRSSLIRTSEFDCPPELLSPDGRCGVDMKRPDLGPDMQLPCPGENKCATQCGAPGCCSCNVCLAAPICRPLPDMGPDGGDKCADPRNCTLPECVGDPRCVTPGREVCNNGIDDNDDGLVDCKDPECATFPGCQIVKCDDNNPDCTLPVCANHPKCKDLRCMPTVDFGTLQPRNSTSTRNVNTTGTTDVTATPCAPGGAGMVVGKFTLVAQSDVTLSFTQPSGKDHVFGLFRAGVNQSCGQNPVSCYDPKSATMGKNTWAALAPGEYYVIAQPFSPQGQGPVTITLTTPSSNEICNNGIDDNGNGLIDCGDPDCTTTPNCINTICNPDINLGALVVNAPGKSASFNTRQANDSGLNLNCQAARGGKDVVIRFTLRETAGILVEWNQSGDHVMALFREPPLGQKCDFDQLSCYDPSRSSGGQVAFGEYPPGEYLLIFKATRPGAEGTVDATISAYRNRRIELCGNGIDDDGNGLVDCADPQCQGVSGCSAPYCQPDRQLGTMAVGDSQTVDLNVLANGSLGYKASCARGGGKGMVVQLTVPPPRTGNGGVSIGFDCTQTGDHVLALYSAGGPRDACDVNELVCGDPKTLPFGCGYAVPNLQPGTYNVIVLGFRAGSEGTVNLTLSIDDDRQLEICNNGIDDDRDGFTDCNDRKCINWPTCTAAQCTPDQRIDPMPLTNTNVFRLVQTAGNGVHGQVPCATTRGGQGAVVEIVLTAKADLRLTWNQIGNHDFALFTREGAALPCDAGSLVGSCVKSNDMINGTATFTGVPQGRYYLLIQGDAPDTMTTQSSGSVNIALSGTPSP